MTWFSPFPPGHSPSVLPQGLCVVRVRGTGNSTRESPASPQCVARSSRRADLAWSRIRPSGGCPGSRGSSTNLRPLAIPALADGHLALLAYVHVERRAHATWTTGCGGGWCRRGGSAAGSRDAREATGRIRFATFNASLNRNVAGQLIERPVDPRQRPGGDRGRDHPAGAARRAADQRVRLRRRRRRPPRCSSTTTCRCRTTARRRSSTRTGSSPRPTPGSRRASTSTTTARSAGPTTPSGSGSSRASSAWPSTRCTRSSSTTSAPSRCSGGPTCPARCCPTIRPRRRRPTGTRRAELDAVRLSSKSHWDLPIDIDGRTVHFLVSHPTPPVFDGPEDRNGTRNHDEIRFWADYVHAGRRPRPTSTTTPGEQGGLGARSPVRHRRRPERRPARRRQRARRRPAAARAPPGQHVGDAVERRGGRRRRAQGGANPTHRGDPALRHRGLRRLHAGEPAGRLCAAVHGR